jgi:mono/diheme cytochrome c family protein|tara:strand:+ start:795 stop:1430 length:636 start_codon:yes stop_codon:yes gene_type:complete
MHNSVKAAVGDMTVPDLSDNDMIQQGASAYDSLCAACHLKPGLKDTVLRAGLNPMPPNLTEQGHWGPAEQFWIVKHGIKMTGMPAWGATHEDEELWEMVAFLKTLPELSEQEYNALIRPNETSSSRQTGNGHAQDDGHDHDHGDMSGMIDSSTNEVEASNDDGHDHDHGEMNGMMGSPESGTTEEISSSESTPPDRNEAELDDHYADGHAH